MFSKFISFENKCLKTQLIKYVWHIRNERDESLGHNIQADIFHSKSRINVTFSVNDKLNFTFLQHSQELSEQHLFPLKIPIWRKINHRSRY